MKGVLAGLREMGYALRVEGGSICYARIKLHA